MSASPGHTTDIPRTYHGASYGHCTDIARASHGHRTFRFLFYLADWAGSAQKYRERKSRDLGMDFFSPHVYVGVGRLRTKI